MTNEPPTHRSPRVVLLAMVVLATGLGSCGPCGSERKTTGLRVSGAKLHVAEANSDGVVELAPGARPVGPTYRVTGHIKPDTTAKLSFDVPGDFRRRRGERLMVATRENRGQLWALLPGQRGRGRVSIRVKHLTDFGLAAVKAIPKRIGQEVDGALKDIRGRRDPPSCTAQLDYHVEVSGTASDSPILYACAEKVDGKPAIHIYNNRAIALEYDAPKDAKVRTLGSGLGEAFWDSVNRGVAAAGSYSGGRLVPGAGEAIISFDSSEPDVEGIDFRPTNQALATDLLVSAVAKAGKGGEKALAELTDFASCVYTATGELRSGVSRRALIRLLTDCGDNLVGTPKAAVAAVLLGLLRTGSAALDQVDIFSRARVELSRNPVRLLPRPGPAPGAFTLRFNTQGQPTAIGRFNITRGDKTIADAEHAFGDPDDLTPAPGTIENGCEITWSALQLTAIAGSFSASGGPCDRDNTFIQYVVIRGDGFQTENGLRVGASEAEMKRLYPDASTRAGDAEIGGRIDSSQGDLYTLLNPPNPIGQLATLQAAVKHGRVRLLEVTPFLAGD